MPVQSNWLLLSEAFDRLGTVATGAAQYIIARGDVPIMALRSDVPGTATPERVETLLARAAAEDVRHLDRRS